MKKAMAYSKEFNELRKEAKKLEGNYQLYITGRKQKQTMLNKHLKRWWDCNLTDAELGIINIEDYQNTYDILKKSINNMDIY